MNSKFIRELLSDLDVKIVTDNYDKEYLKNLGSKENVIVQINGDIIGYHKDPVYLYNKLKNYKRSGIIYPMTSIVWYVKNSIIQISTEAGRMFRPLLIVDTDKETGYKELRIIKILKKLNVSWNEFSKDKNFETFISPCAGYYNDMNICDKDYDEGFIEYLDSDELNNSMIAINYHELYKGMKGPSCPPLYTHCEFILV